MKRFLPLILVVVLVAAMAVPAMAAGQYPSVPNERKYMIVTDQGALFAHTFDSFTVEENQVVLNNYMSFRLLYGASVWEQLDTRDSASLSKSLTVVYDNSGVFDVEDPIEFLPDVCDGSACPATDANHDDICDDCGLPMAFSLRDDTTYDYNGVVLPVLPSFDQEEFPYFYIVSNATTGSASLTGSSVPLAHNERNNSMVYAAEGKNIIYDYDAASFSWVLRVSNNVQTFQTAAQPYTLVTWSNFDLKNVYGNTLFEGDPNFMPPLWEEMDKVTQGEMTGLAQTMGGTMKVLVLCGVGLMACLVVLNLFGRRSLISRH